MPQHQLYLPELSLRKGAVDIGAGSGPLLPWLVESGFDPVLGVEPSRSAISALRNQRTKKGHGLLVRDNPQPIEVKLAADLRRVESLREWRGSGVLSTSL